MSSRMVNAAGLRKIETRQLPYRFRADYIPSILASREEAPSISSPAFIKAPRWRRTIHCLSTQEVIAVLLALLHPRLLDLHEQKMIPRWPLPHPVCGMPGVESEGLPIFRGSVEVASRLGYLDTLPLVWDIGARGERIRVVYPYVGDVMLFLRDDTGVYCVNWSVKSGKGDHILPGPDVRKPHTQGDLRAARARFEIELETYADVGIRTVAVAGQAIDPILAANLQRAYPYCCQEVVIREDLRRRILNLYRQAIDHGAPPSEVLTHLVAHGICDAYVARHTFYTAPFEGDLRLDLTRPLLFDCSVKILPSDAPPPHADWFAR